MVGKTQSLFVRWPFGDFVVGAATTLIRVLVVVEAVVERYAPGCSALEPELELEEPTELLALTCGALPGAGFTTATITVLLVFGVNCCCSNWFLIICTIWSMLVLLLWTLFGNVKVVTIGPEFAVVSICWLVDGPFENPPPWPGQLVGLVRLLFAAPADDVSDHWGRPPDG